MKKHLFYTFLLLFVATTAVTLLGVTKVIAVDDKYLMPLFTSLILELIGAVITAFRKLDFSETGEQRGPDRDTSQRAEDRAPTTPRGYSLLHAATSVGLVDIEDRDSDIRSLPPDKLYNFVTRDVLLTGVSLAGTFSRQLHRITGLLERDKRVFVMLLHPNAPDVTRLGSLVNRELQKEIGATIATIAAHKLQQHTNFAVRFLDRMPSYTAVLIDGDPTTINTPRDLNGQVRVQPVRVHANHHHGLVIHLKKLDTSPCAFDFFAGDLRLQWERDAKEHPALFA